MANLKDWDFSSSHVESDANVANEKYIGSHSVLVAAGPPKLKDLTDDEDGGDNSGTEIDATGNDTGIVYPIGIIQNLRMNQNRQVKKLFEIGSERAYHIPGRLIGQLNMGRVLYSGESLLNVLTAGLKTTGDGRYDGSDDHASASKTKDIDKDVNADPASGKFWINLASEFFSSPVGLMFYLKDQSNQDYGQFYVESAMINTHSFQMGAGTSVITENASMQFDQAKPIELTNTDEA